MKTSNRLLTGDRPTGKLHLGHYVGSLQNRVRLQDQHPTFILVADLHMLTTKNDRTDIEQIYGHAKEMVLDQLAAGLDPEKVTFYMQSGIPEIAVLNTLFQSLVTVPRLERIPSLKDMARAANKDEMPYALLGYPVLQSADVLSLKAGLVPVGKDNLAHIELTREIARRFNFLYGTVFAEPEPLVGEVPTLVGTDGKEKMSKSLDNAIFLSDDAEAVRKKVHSMYTDPNRVRADTPGRVEGNPVFIYHDAFNSNRAEVEDLKARYLLGTVGDREVKEKLTIALNAFLEPMRVRRAQYLTPGYIDHLLVTGTEKVRVEIQQTLDEVQRAMGFATVHKKLRAKARAYSENLVQAHTITLNQP
jgi:tryptophanyl-tRNA synthetase